MGFWVDSEALGFGKLLYRRQPLHKSRTRKLLDRDIICVASAIVEVLLVIIFVSVEVDAAWNVCLKECEDAKEHFGADILIQLDIVVIVYSFFVAKTALYEQLNLLLCFNTVQECVTKKGEEIVD